MLSALPIYLGLCPHLIQFYSLDCQLGFKVITIRIIRNIILTFIVICGIRCSFIKIGIFSILWITFCGVKLFRLTQIVNYGVLEHHITLGNKVGTGRFLILNLVHFIGGWANHLINWRFLGSPLLQFLFLQDGYLLHYQRMKAFNVEGHSQ